MINRILIICCLFVVSSQLKAQKEHSKFEIGVFYTPPGIAGKNWKKSYVFSPYVTRSNTLIGSYESRSKSQLLF